MNYFLNNYGITNRESKLKKHFDGWFINVNDKTLYHFGK